MNGQIAFGSRIKELRKNKNITQEKLAEIIGVEPQQICRIEKGACFTTFETLEKLSNALNTPIQDFFNYSHIKTKEELLKDLTNSLEEIPEDKLRMVYKVIMTIIN